MHFLLHLIYDESQFICEDANFGIGLSTVVENDESTEPIVWLQSNDNCVLRHRGPCTVHSGPGEAGEHINRMLIFFKKN